MRPAITCEPHIAFLFPEEARRYFYRLRPKIHGPAASGALIADTAQGPSIDGAVLFSTLSVSGIPVWQYLATTGRDAAQCLPDTPIRNNGLDALNARRAPTGRNSGRAENHGCRASEADMSSHEVPSTAANRMAAPGNDLLEKLGDLMLRQRPPIFNVVFSVVCLVGAIFLRFAVDLYLPPGFPFLTFFPAVLLAAVFAGVRAGIVVAVLSGLAAWYYFLPPVNSLELSANTAVAMGFYTLIVATELVLIAATKQAHARLKGANERSSHLARSRELMFNELQHRVSNNLATVAALLRMQAGRTLDEGARQSLSEAQVRIGTISRLQRRLHSPNIQSVDAGIFLRDIADDSMEAAGSDGDRVLLDLQSVLLPHERAIPLGLIVSELLMNAVEHGRPDPTRQLTLSLRTQAIPNDTEHLRVTIRVRDRGPGVPEDFRVENSTSLGLGIARQFAAQLGGTLDITNAPDGGAVAELVFDTPIPV